jgi:uncharacterized protein YjiS (DUF1127 family)
MEPAMKPESSYALPDFAARSITFVAPFHRIREIMPLMAELRRRNEYRADLKRLLKVGPHMIDDIGLGREEALRESEKPFWKP